MESLTNLFKKNTPNTNTPEKSTPKPEKSQEELRRILENKIKSLRSPIEELIKEYQTSLEDGKFDDQEDEEEGKGEERKMSMQKKLNSMLDKVEKMKTKLDSNEILSSLTESIESSYTFPDTGKVEQITLNIEQKLNEYISFYDSHGVETPDNFEEDIKDIWEANLGDMRKQIETHGFNEILLIPPTPDLSDLAEKMKEAAYHEDDDFFKKEGGFKKAQSQNQDKVRLILTYKTQNLKDHPELVKTLNIKGENVPLDKMLSLEEYLIFCKKYFEETNRHLDEFGWTWLAIKADDYLVCSNWRSRHDERNITHGYLPIQLGTMGYRLSRSYTE